MYLCNMIPLIEYITNALRADYQQDELRDLAWWVAEEATGMSRTQLLTERKDIQNIPNLEIILQKLRQHEPVQYVFGHTQWMGLDLKVTPATLIPRLETAELVEWVLAMFPIQKSPILSGHSTLRVADIGTGSGCIAIALKRQRPTWDITGIDISEEALTIAQQNGQQNNANISWIRKDIHTDEIGDFDIIVSNPPYICEQERSTMERRVLDYEPASALFVPDTDPLLFYRRIADIRHARHLFFEINELYATEVQQMLMKSGYTDIQLKHDIYGKPRMVYARIAE